MSSEKVLVLNATGKVGKNACLALKEAGFDVYGTTRSQAGELQKIGVWRDNLLIGIKRSN